MSASSPRGAIQSEPSGDDTHNESPLLEDIDYLFGYEAPLPDVAANVATASAAAPAEESRSQSSPRPERSFSAAAATATAARAAASFSLSTLFSCLDGVLSPE